MKVDMLFCHAIDYKESFECLHIMQVTQAISIAKGQHPEWTLSCSRQDQLLGTVGFFCTGNVVEMYDRDCFSVRNADGSRTAGEGYTPCTVSDWFNSPYETEAFVNNIKVVSFWIKKEAYERYVKNEWMAKSIERLTKLGYPLEIV